MKKILSFFVVVFVIINLLWQVFALSNEEASFLKNKFNSEKQDFVFENIEDVNAMDALDLFKTNSKKNIYENVLKEVALKRKKLQEDNLEVLKKIESLQEQLKDLDNSIKNLKEETRKININIVNKIVEINDKKKQIEETNKKIEKTTDILRKYIVYIYKKWNLFLDKWKLDNFKAILLSWKSIDKVLDDIYFKEILAQAWKNLIKKLRRLAFDLYIQKKWLENDVSTLKKLRKNLAIKKKIIENKKKFKEKILSISKWKDALYKKYIKSKIEIEKKLQLKAFAERVKFYNASKKILWKYGCKFVDVSKNTPETRLLSKKCYTLNKIISLEAKLEENKIKNKDKDNENIFSWPVSPYNWISAYFKDENYKKTFKIEHNAIDIKTPQGTNIKAPADWYVIDIKRPVDSSYAYITLKHADWFVTVYGHISSILDNIEKYSYIKKWDIFAQTGWSFWTLWAWYLTTWPHLHFEVLKDKQFVDPLQYLDLSYLDYKDVPDYLRTKFAVDYRNRTWKEYFKKSEYNWRLFILEWSTEIERQKSLLRKYARSDFADWNMWVEEALRWHIDPTFMMCIGLAETGLWRHMKTPYNVWNVWNVDSGWTWTMQSPRQWIWWIWHTLNNKYLRRYNEIYKLSWYWRKWNEPIYASSKKNWHRNVIKCMSAIKGYHVPDDYNFRTY